ncbi:MAG: glycosyltransferase family 39 protein [Synechococcales bacterium]|nr:glycosyltransferase family 39 protein [Synechococcales bacterium]
MRKWASDVEEKQHSVGSEAVWKLKRPFIWLGLIWLASASFDLGWLLLDQSVPSWDPADHLIGALNYRWALLQAQWFSQDWWSGLWTLSSKYPPLLYLSTAPFLIFLGTGSDQAIAVNLLYSAILLISVYGIGQALFNPRVGLWAAGLCVLFPQFYTLRSQYFMDYPLTALTALSFWLLTLWRNASRQRDQWTLGLGFGVCFGLALLMKQTALFFFIVPLIWVLGEALWSRAGSRVTQLISGLAIAAWIMLPWARTNWVFQISAAFTANVRSAEIEGDPAINSLDAWVYYWQHLPQAVSYPLLMVPGVGLLLTAAGIWRRASLGPEVSPHVLRSLAWLGLFLIGAYGIWSAFANKDVRYVMPYLPALSVVLAYGLSCYPRRWGAVPWGTVGLAIALLMLNLFPIGDPISSWLTQTLTPSARHQPQLEVAVPHAEIVDELIRAQPQQIINLGVLPSTPEINQHNLNFYGSLQDFRVYARRMGKSEDHIDQDLRSMSWFLSVTRPQLNHHDPKSRRRQMDILRDLKRRPDFVRQRRWLLPDGSRLELFRRRVLPVEVQRLETGPDQVRLEAIALPPTSPPGKAIPITYTWSGSWQALHDGLVLLTWRSPLPQADASVGSPSWHHDHGIGLGTLIPQPIQAHQPTLAPAVVSADQGARVIEHTAMLPPGGTPSGTYTLEAQYFNPKTGETYPLEVPAGAAIAISPDAAISEAPELDAITQLRTLAQNLPQGLDALDPVFDQVGRLNLYDPVQSYLTQAEAALTYRLQQDPDNRDDTYGLVLAMVLQRDVDGAIAALQQAIQLDPDNPYPYAYLSFVNLYALRPHAARRAADRAIALDPNRPEFRALRGLAALLQGNLWQARSDFHTFWGTHPA